MPGLLTLALVVGVQDDENVLQSDHHDQGPDDERQDTDQVVPRWGRATKDTGEDVKRAGPDIAVNDTNGLVSQEE